MHMSMHIVVVFVEPFPTVLCFAGQVGLIKVPGPPTYWQTLKTESSQAKPNQVDTKGKGLKDGLHAHTDVS